MSGLRVGIALDDDRALAVLVNDNDTVLAHHTLEAAAPEPSPGLLRRVLTGLAAGPILERVERVVVATSAPADRLRRPAALGPVGVLRIAAPATTSVPPLTGWPSALVEAVRGPVAVIGGGHQYDGREFVPLDLAAVRAFAEACRGGVRAVAVAGAGAHMNPDHEERARTVLTELLGPDTPVVTSHDVGGAGLLERENTVVLGAAVAPAVQRFTDDAAAALATTGMGADLYLVTGDGTVLPAGRAVRHPLALLGAPHGAARAGAARLSGRDVLVVVDAGGGVVRISAQVGGSPVEAGPFSEVAGVRTGIRGIRVAEIPLGTPIAGALRAGALRAGAVRRAVDGARGGPVVVVGPGAAELPLDTDGALEIIRPPLGRLAAALGAATGEASGTVDALFFYGDGGREDCVAAARRGARELAIRRGADPRTVRVGEAREGAMTYVPVRCIRLRVTATGPVLATGDDMRIPFAYADDHAPPAWDPETAADPGGSNAGGSNAAGSNAGGRNPGGPR